MKLCFLIGLITLASVFLFVFIFRRCDGEWLWAKLKKTPPKHIGERKMRGKSQ